MAEGRAPWKTWKLLHHLGFVFARGLRVVNGIAVSRAVGFTPPLPWLLARKLPARLPGPPNTSPSLFTQLGLAEAPPAYVIGDIQNPAVLAHAVKNAVSRISFFTSLPKRC